MEPLLAPSLSFDDRIASRTARLGVVGLGYAGLPLAMAFAEAGFAVTGIDVTGARRAVNRRRSYLVDVPAERYAVLDGRLAATTELRAIAELDALTICVPTPLSKTRTPDLSYIVAAVESVAANLRPGQLVVLQSTTSPGTTRRSSSRSSSDGGKVGMTSSWATRPSAWTPATALGHPQHARSSSPASPPSACGAPRCSTARSPTRDPDRRARRSPRPRSSMRTPSAR